MAALLSFTAQAATLENPNGYNAFGGTGTTQGTTNAFYVAGTYTLTLGTPQVKYLNVSSDLATSKVQFYCVTNEVTVSSVVLGTTNAVITATNGYAAGDIVVIRHVSADTYERLKVLSVSLTNQITLSTAPIQTLGAGDKIWRAAPAGFINIGAASNSVPISAGSSYAGQYNKPLLIEINGTAWSQINTVSGDYH